MNVKKVLVLKEAAMDLEEGRLFYDRKEKGIGDYFFNCLKGSIHLTVPSKL
ncbi:MULTISPECIES: hypothetical protein [Candidatus Kuenenia]|uniref:Uncharacterized protein n=1 Tax=Kuenenia stuttgartiensis TaxID=174633 RepID=A0A2C9CI14_KUEST|nr:MULTISPECIES: hypothetical protein [Kuenenia]MCZ7622681.1 hypothetical protein [Candidatus Kuenenia sp.]SOH05384.1 hypothetical protein KSMBR1_2903 [Candidatus Kuenenia stuttgartiensis]